MSWPGLVGGMLALFLSGFPRLGLLGLWFRVAGLVAVGCQGLVTVGGGGGMVTVFVVLARCLVVFRLVPGTPILLPLLALTASVGGRNV